MALAKITTDELCNAILDILKNDKGFLSGFDISELLYALKERGIKCETPTRYNSVVTDLSMALGKLFASGQIKLEVLLANTYYIRFCLNSDHPS